MALRRCKREGKSGWRHYDIWAGRMARSWLSDLRCVIFAAGEYPSPCFSFNSRASAWDWIWVCLCLLQKGRTSALHLHPLQEIL